MFKERGVRLAFVGETSKRHWSSGSNAFSMAAEPPQSVARCFSAACCGLTGHRGFKRRGRHVLSALPNALALKRADSIERLWLLGLVTPAMLLIVITMVLPVGWLFDLSLLSDTGAFNT